MKVKPIALQSINDCLMRTLSLLILFSKQVINCYDFREFCQNRPNVTIESIVSLDNKTIFVSTDSHYALIEAMTRDHLPIVANGYPKVIDEEFEELRTNRTNVSALDYQFVGNEYYLKGSDQNDRQFIGFNQVWMGCPQPLCLQGGVDAVLKAEGFDENSLNIKVFRGKYFWEIGNYSEPPLVESAHLIAHKWESPELDLPIDAAFTTWNLNEVFFKGNKTLEFGLTSSSNDINKVYKGIPNDVNAVMYWDTGTIDKEILFVFKDESVWALRNSAVMDGWPKNLSDLNPSLPNSIDSALIDYDDNVFLFKGSVFYTFKAHYLESNSLSKQTLTPRLIFKDFFHCNEALYSEWGFHSYHDFLLKYYHKSATDEIRYSTETVIRSSFLDDFQQIFLKSEKSTQINWLVVLIVFTAIVTFSLIGVLVLMYCISRIKRRSDASKNIEILAVMRPLMTENGNHFDIISIEELPKKGKKNSLKLNRTKLSDDAYG